MVLELQAASAERFGVEDDRDVPQRLGGVDDAVVGEDGEWVKPISCTLAQSQHHHRQQNLREWSDRVAGHTQAVSAAPREGL